MNCTTKTSSFAVIPSSRFWRSRSPRPRFRRGGRRQADDRHPLAEVGSLVRRLLAGGARSDDDDVVLEAHARPRPACHAGVTRGGSRFFAARAQPAPAKFPTRGAARGSARAGCSEARPSGSPPPDHRTRASDHPRRARSQGHPTLHTDEGRTRLSPGMCAGFKAGSGHGHHLINETAKKCCTSRWETGLLVTKGAIRTTTLRR